MLLSFSQILSFLNTKKISNTPRDAKAFWRHSENPYLSRKQTNIPNQNLPPKFSNFCKKLIDNLPPTLKKNI
jgi:hypothetical protein